MSTREESLYEKFSDVNVKRYKHVRRRPHIGKYPTDPEDLEDGTDT